MSTVFGKIINGELPAEKVFESDTVIAIKDIEPKAPVHLLIIPKKEIKDIQSVEEKDLPIIQDMIRVAQTLAKEFSVETGYRLIFNNGESAGQTVFHLHLHLIGGKPLGDLV